MFVVNPNKSLASEQVAQLRAALGEGVRVLEMPAYFPPAAQGGLAEPAYRSALGYPSPDKLTGWVPTGFSTGACAILATLHGRDGSRFPTAVVFGAPPDYPFIGTVSLDALRTTQREVRFGKVEADPAAGEVVVLNFTHPIREKATDGSFVLGDRAQEVAGLLGVPAEQIDFREGLGRQFVYETVEELVEQVVGTLDAARLGAEAWQHARIVVNIHSHGAGAAIALAALHGRMGYFPVALRSEFWSVDKGGDGKHHYTEVIRLNDLRERARRTDQQSRQMVLLPRGLVERLSLALETAAAVATEALSGQADYDRGIIEEVRRYLDAQS